MGRELSPCYLFILLGVEGSIGNYMGDFKLGITLNELIEKGPKNLPSNLSPLSTDQPMGRADLAGVESPTLWA